MVRYTLTAGAMSEAARAFVRAMLGLGAAATTALLFVRRRRARRTASQPYLQRRRPRYVLSTTTVLDAPVERVFDFFSRPENLAVITPPRMGFVIIGVSGAMGYGTLIRYRIRIAGIPVTWLTGIEVWEPGRRFVDAQLSGPYHCWWHEHVFVPDGDARTIMHDRVLYTPPFGIIGRIANALFIRRELREIFAFRARAITDRFGTPAPATKRVAS
jgi:ligand-binding SRPBCC domain-containing protein